MKTRRLRSGDPGYRHPYVDYETDPLWTLIEQGISDLVTNHDLIEQTGRDHIVGFLCKAILNGQKKASTLPRSSED